MASHAEQQPQATGEHPAEPGQSHPHADGGSHAKHGKGHKDGHGAGAHGGTWLVTYCDMITLLIAFFIAIITFASQESGNQKYPKMRDSILYGAGGSGLAGDPHRGTDHDAVVWRQFLMAAQPSGSKIPPLHTDPSLDKTGEVLRLLEQPTLGTLIDSYAMRLSLAIMLDDDNRLASTGKQILQAIGRNFRFLPYDILIQVDGPGNLSKGVTMARFLARQGIEPGRIGTGLHPGPSHGVSSVWLMFAKRP